MKKTAWVLSTLMFLVLLTVVNAKAVLAGAKLYVDPSSGTRTLGETFTVTVMVNSAGEVVGGADALGTYDSTRLELVGSATEASDMVFRTVEGGGSCANGTSGSGKFSFSCNANSVLGSSAVSGSLMVLTFKAKATGTATVNFTCTSGSTTDSNIVKSSTSTDVISCSENGSGSYTIVEGSSDSSDDTTTVTETTELPQTGSVGMTIGLTVFGLISLASAMFLKFL